MTPGRLADLSDAELLTRIAEQSSRDALRELYDRHVGWLRARLRNRCADDSVVEDALQDTFVAVWRGAGSYSGSGAVAAWVWGIAIRRLVGQLRRRPIVRELHQTSAVVESAEDRVLAGAEHGDVADAIARLSPELQAVLQATVLDGLSTKEAARLLGIPQGTVKTRMMRVRRELRGALA